MKKFSRRLLVKVLAVGLFCVSFTALIASAFGFAYCYYSGIFDESSDNYYLSSQFEDAVTQKLQEADFAIRSSETAPETSLQQFSSGSNVFFRLYDLGNTLLLDTTPVNATVRETGLSLQRTEYRLEAIVISPLTQHDILYQQEFYYGFLYTMRNLFGVIAVPCLVLCLGLIVLLMTGAGHRNGSDVCSLNLADRIPFDFYAALLGTGIFFCGYFLVAVMERTVDLWSLYLVCPTLVFIGLLLIALLMSAASRVKSGKWWLNTVLYQLYRVIYLIFAFVFKTIWALLTGLPVVWKLVLISMLYAALSVCAFTLNSRVLAYIWLGVTVVLFVGLCLCAIFMNRIKNSIRSMALGKIDQKINTDSMFWDFRRCADDLNNLRQGMNKVVEEQLKSERFKAELITNVSHDIKTPLTSIINYIDLLKKQQITDATTASYIAVLDRQSQRLKKLTEDLVEASKASTGNLAVDLQPTDIRELLSQSSGEYAERLEARGLSLQTELPEDSVFALADGRLLWRVFDNLLNNICNYSLPGTRVYLSLTQSGKTVEVCFKNISSEALNISPEELTERFVRGDSARSTEGSGLGLSIAKSLTELQQGRLTLNIDGDLFKAVVSLGIVNPPVREESHA